MTTVEAAENLIHQHTISLGNELVDLDQCTGRILAESITADRDFPPFDRVTMDGIAIRYQHLEQGGTSFRVTGVQAAGSAPLRIEQPDEAIEIMTGAVLPRGADTIIPYEQLIISGDQQKTATLSTSTVKGKNIHRKGSDRKKGTEILKPGAVLDAPEIGVAATVGKSVLTVLKPPSVAIISTGDELVPVEEIPLPHQIRSSNALTLSSSLNEWHIDADRFHILDDLTGTTNKLAELLENYQILIISGGVSKGKFDFVPQALEHLQVKKHFHRIKQRPGKPFWFGSHHSGTLVFAFPGNPVSSFMCFSRYMKPWLNRIFGLPSPAVIAKLAGDISFAPDLTYFAQVKISMEQETLFAYPVEGHGSGDLANLVDADAFMELPSGKQHFLQGESYPVYGYRRSVLSNLS